MTCKKCLSRVKDWEGDDPVCGFERGEFHEENWNCATIAELRTVLRDRPIPFPSGIDYVYSNDQIYATIQVDGVSGLDRALALWVTWYKTRGRTEGMWLLFDNKPPRKPTEKELLLVINHYKALLD